MRQVRAHKQREESAKRAASEAHESSRAAEGLASRTSAELVRANSEIASLKQKLAEAPRREEALKRQLAARTEQLEALQKAPQPPPAAGMLTGGARSPPRTDGGGGSTSRGGGGGGDDAPPYITPGEQAAAVAEAVAKAVAAERGRWSEVSAAVEGVQEARQGDERVRASHAAQIARAQAMVNDAERGRQEAMAQAAHMRTALAEAEARLSARGEDTAAAAAAARAAGAASTSSARADDGSAYEVEQRTAAAVRRSRDAPAGVMSPPRAMPPPPSSGTAGTLAVERWAAEKRLQRKVEGLRTKLNEKSRELSVAEGELAKARSALEGASKREVAMREGMVHAQDQLKAAGRDRDSQLSGALQEMRSREELSGELHKAQVELARLRAQARTHQRSAGSEGPSSPFGAFGVDTDERGDVNDPDAMRNALLERDQKLLEQGFALEANELTIAQLQARLRDQAAYQSLLSSSGGGAAVGGGAAGAADKASPPRGGTGGGAGGRPRSAGAGGGVGREELGVVVEKMERVISNLQAENGELRKKAVSTVRSPPYRPCCNAALPFSSHRPLLPPARLLPCSPHRPLVRSVTSSSQRRSKS